VLHAEQHARHLPRANSEGAEMVATLAQYVQHRRPLVEQASETDRRDLLIEHVDKVVNLSKDEQTLIPFRAREL
jgi:hypothetical protein